MRRHIPITVLLAFAALTALAEPTLAAEQAERPNILFIYTDDQSHRSVSCYEEAHPWVRTPNIDRLAAEGVRFTDAYVGTWCLPSRAMMLTGRHPHGIHGMRVTRNPHGEYDPDVCRFWPAVLRKAGYTTAMIGKWHLSEDAGHGRDWDRSWVWNHAVPSKGGGYYLNQKINFDGGPYKPVGGYSTDNYTDWAEQFVRGEHEQPWFLWLCYDAVHGPYTCARRHKGEYRDVPPVPVPEDIYPPRPTKPTYMHQRAQWKPGPGGEPLNGDRTLDQRVRQYNRAVMAIDEGVGRLVQVLGDTGQLDKTLIVYTSDQGFAWGQHGFAWKVAPYDANLRAPMIVRYPARFASGQVCRRPIGALDLIPMFFRLAGTELPWKMHGNDVTPLLENPDADWPHPVLLEHTGWAFGDETDPGVTGPKNFGSVPWWVSLREGRFKYIRTLVPGEIDELYDLEADPEELTNLALDPGYREKLEQMRAKLISELERVDAPMAEEIEKSEE
jgi:arylsulfatase A-like enzyme